MTVPTDPGPKLADVYHPADGGRYPVLANRTPYGKREQRYVDDALPVDRPSRRTLPVITG